MDFPLSLNPHSPIPLHQQLYEELRRSILTGRLLPQHRLPSSRSLAKLLGISRTTVTQSYDRLLSEGYLETIQGSGTYVCSQLPDELLHSAPVQPGDRPSQSPIRLSSYGDYLAQTSFQLQPEPDQPICFRYGRPAFDRFPLPVWRRLLSRHSRSLDWMDYATDMQGYRPLREAIAQYVGRARAVQCTPEQVVITNGTQQALDLMMRLLITPGDTIAIEDPGYLSAQRIFLSHGAKLLPIPVDEAGLQVETLTKPIAYPVRLVYITPSHQFPTGATLSLPRRLELLAWAEQQQSMILEDDYDSEYRYGDRPIPALQGLSQSYAVIYIGTFSKVLFPSLRIGYLVLPHSLVSITAQAKWLSDRHLPLLDQRVLTDFILEGHLESHIRKMRSFYDQNRQALVQALRIHFGEQITILGDKAGMHLMVRLQTHWSDAELVQRAEQVGVGIMLAQPHYLTPADRHELIFGYSELETAQIQIGIARLAQALYPNF
ncbi:MocR-like pyridoxine biosynthesis transcription factor PdxR [Egbenema bharatensis]|uniref:MocR-like pyridoxine biosynthesis transcription factor PdxR n=1 Tax=Egbenema bharatensis TaxID=3463334 RepID=UPI003A84D203